eukprot:462915-Pyramimonas_sp.AAC.1
MEPLASSSSSSSSSPSPSSPSSFFSSSSAASSVASLVQAQHAPPPRFCPRSLGHGRHNSEIEELVTAMEDRLQVVHPAVFQGLHDVPSRAPSDDAGAAVDALPPAGPELLPGLADAGPLVLATLHAAENLHHVGEIELQIVDFLGGILATLPARDGGLGLVRIGEHFGKSTVQL